ncbi:OmpA family protein [Roseinatronobacter alkalisoli]|uniref:OmpA family protein n=1 Tax=Roseinatronobacter alkalisoli TaxID=3028235 RepID=A0ABT5TDA7_9RHOB|nr:OmpA family protein [Roseinatronobacter sp. HJB301]MDD7972137.1 OmpA family protein [Roseinatronobacter sp. HJB301]
MRNRISHIMAVLQNDPITVLQRYKGYALAIAAFLLAAFLAVAGASLSVRAIELLLVREARAALHEAEIDWPEIQADGLLVTMNGQAASEAERFRALGIVSAVVGAERVIDGLTVAPSIAISAPRFSVEMMRNGLDVSLIGLVPESYDVSGIVRQIEGIGPEVSVVNMVETASHAIPFGWERSVEYALKAMALVPVSKISVSADQVEIYGLAESERQRDDFRQRLQRERPRGVIASIEISAPRPAITPFTLRFVIDGEGARFDACSADSQEARAAILQAARQAGASGVLECTIGLGSPSPRWQAAAVAALRAVADAGAGTVTFSDTDISFVVPNAVEIAEFDRIVGRLENALPDIFSLQADRLPPEEGELEAQGDAVEFSASLSPEGSVTLQGRLTDERLRSALLSMARSEFGMSAVEIQANITPDTPEGWPVRTMLAVDVLSYLEHGSVRVRPTQIDVRGVTGDTASSDRISQLLADRLGPGARFNLNISYDERFDPVAMQPTPARCEAWIKDILAEEQITFDPGSASLVADAARVLDQIAEILRDCGRLEMEIAGHTDSQGRLETNMRLSQQRAEAVMAALLARGIPISGFEARGYGPEFPIADNSTASGREANRRIEFRLIGDSAAAAREETGEDVPEEPRDESELEIEVTTGAGDAPRPPPRPERP